MVATNRNFNIEEIDTDLIDLPFIKHQTVLQKIIFYGCVIGGIGTMLVLTFTTEIPAILTTLLFLLFGGVGVLFGGNYNEDLSLWQYIIYKLTQRTAYLEPVSSEDARAIEREAARIERDEKAKENDVRARDPNESRRMLKMLLTIVIVFVTLIVGLVAVITYRKGTTDTTHHTIETVVEESTDTTAE